MPGRNVWIRIVTDFPVKCPINQTDSQTKYSTARENYFLWMILYQIVFIDKIKSDLILRMRKSSLVLYRRKENIGTVN